MLAKKQANGEMLIMNNVIATLASSLASRPPLFAAWVVMSEPAVAEALVREGFDTAVLDMQHGIMDLDNVIAGIGLIALAGKPAIVRVPVGDFALAARVLDAGAAAVIAPMINSVADARQFASFLKFPPVGERSWGPHRAITLSGLDAQGYLKQSGQFQLAIAMIETREALAALDDILAVPGIDGVFVGPSDLSIALTNGAVMDVNHPDVDAALTHIAARAKAHSKIAAAFCVDGKRAKTLAARGFSLCSVATDTLMLKAGARAELAAAR